jgi:LmbE family N-acetylglucosaminyl deacetylase
MRWIYLSPHPDDAALCAGGLIFDQSRAGREVQIWTLFSGIPVTEHLSDFARKMHAKWGTNTARGTVLLRREEDLRAGAILRARVRHFDFLDAIYRQGAGGTALYGDPVGAPLSKDDEALPERIAREIDRRVLPDDRIVCLLGIGGHVDHLLVRRAAESLGRPLRFVADFPYILKDPESVGAATSGLQAAVSPVSAAGLEAWIEAVEAHRSQLRAVFEDLDEKAVIREYWKSTGGVRFWAPVPRGDTLALDSGQEA